MDLGVLDRMDTPRLKEYLRWLLWHFRVMDGFWFLSVEKKFDRRAAEELDEMVWGKIAGMSSRDLVKRFNITEKGIDGLVKAMEMCPWTMIVGYHITREGNDAYITVPTCPTQVARVRHGLPEFHYRDMHQTEFESFAHGVDPAIRVECLLSPPDHPPDLFCKWRFYVGD